MERSFAGDEPAVGDGVPAVGDGVSAAEVAAGAAADGRQRPWSKEAIRYGALRLSYALIGAAIATIVIVQLARSLRNFLSIMVMSLFLSFAVEPAVNWLAARGWRRGLATGLIFLLTLAVVGLLFALIVPAVISGVKQLIDAAPGMLDRLQEWAGKVGIDFSSQKLLDELRGNADKVASSAVALTGGLLGLGASILGLIFKWATIALFLFYFVAEAPKVRRAVCRRLPPARQKEVLFVWEEAIAKTGAYFYSRLLLAAVNGTGMYLTLRFLQVPFAAPLALFEGIVSEFIPVVGTYIGGAIPILVALLFHPMDAVGVLIYVLVYQQVENYLLSPRLTARTMALHPAVAFAAAMIGGALGGVLMAFLALPAAAVIQSIVQQFGKGYEVVESELTRDVERRGAGRRRSGGRQQRTEDGAPEA